MQIQLHDRLTNPLTIPATRVVIRDRNGNPIALAMEMDDQGTYIVSNITQPDFNRYLKMLGIDRTTIVETLDLTGTQHG